MEGGARSAKGRLRRAGRNGLSRHVPAPTGGGEGKGRARWPEPEQEQEQEPGPGPGTEAGTGAGTGAKAEVSGAKPARAARLGSQGKVPADFMAGEGRHLPGHIPGARVEVDGIAAARPPAPLPLAAGRRPRLLELGSHWPRAVPVGVLPLLGMILSGPSWGGGLLLPMDGAWRAWTALTGALAPLVLWMPPRTRHSHPRSRPRRDRPRIPEGGARSEDHPDRVPR
ncbi:hypothetical protein HEK616_05170 [Streptomyces nigrescens]|uniref:Integral membrane protein n=1 Tax=Streptomyces nigrescens TaxID=1920 RepID=A0ABM7ZKU9_STRNI|nr:hypothetical protein HEK616_05170 [Streptomyces nigrescens]